MLLLMKWLPSQAYLLECLTYDPETGRLTWKTRPLHHFKHADAQAAWNGYFAAKPAGSQYDRYVKIVINGCQILAHRVIWAMQTGEWPPQIDHANRDGRDNRWLNLRKATTQQNKWNRSRPTRDLPRGVRRSRRGPRFTAQAKIDHKHIHIGSFDTPEEAHAAWRRHVERERGEFFRAD